MASVTVNNPTKLTRGSPTKLGHIGALNQVVQFNVPEPSRDNQGFIIITANGTSGTNPPTLEVSIDAGASWAVFQGSSSTIVLNVTGQLNGDNASAAADAFQVAGMGSGATFRYGWSAGTPNADVWALAG
jgi:hypothetical protein